MEKRSFLGGTTFRDSQELLPSCAASSRANSLQKSKHEDHTNYFKREIPSEPIKVEWIMSMIETKENPRQDFCIHCRQEESICQVKPRCCQNHICKVNSAAAIIITVPSVQSVNCWTHMTKFATRKPSAYIKKNSFRDNIMTEDFSPKSWLSKSANFSASYQEEVCWNNPLFCVTMFYGSQSAFYHQSPANEKPLAHWPSKDKKR